ncbi:TetR family transcriptional regulator [Corynebacterium sp. zg254]|uniref:TetR family transcriptional regulator n=1 Tax=Corynebacterium zhongnanshanii TaxID=2768834 RepID=A0ABQ6VJP1_9CORY|nr:MULTISPECIES: TetR/AcrR family transcriptional regulator [Corynebacterium]KAB3522706.1 TetR family transcriptional regulator [Corynebacterium zhongnanshanii]MCR5914239.1 TetR family transcriptional regulator [Corynebacterium sp. zg254]
MAEQSAGPERCVRSERPAHAGRSVREEKRRATHAALQDHATRLVLERGFDAVTVEDICTAVGISPRTFFNYFPSKEVAVLGPEPELPGEASVEWFDGTRAEVAAEPSLVYRVLALMFRLVTSELRSDQYRPEITRRRRVIREENPALARSFFAKFHALHEDVEQHLAEFLRQRPECRRLSEQQCHASREAGVIVAMVSAALNTGFKQWQQAEPTNPAVAFEYCRQTLEAMTLIASTSTGGAGTP